MATRYVIDCANCGWKSPRASRPGRAIEAHKRHSCKRHLARSATAEIAPAESLTPPVVTT